MAASFFRASRRIFNQSACSVSHPSSFNDSAKRVGIIGATGRLGQKMATKILSDAVLPVNLPRDIFQWPPSQQKNFLKSHNIDLVLNCSGVSKGSFKDMMDTNCHGPKQLAEAATDVGVPFFQTSTTATQIKGISSDKTPYAFSKRKGEEALAPIPGVKKFSLDVLVGDKESDQISIGYLAGSRIVPVTVRLAGLHQIFQPTSYDAATTGIGNAVRRCLHDSCDSVPSTVNIVGDPISVNDFISLMNPRSLQIHLDPDRLGKLAGLVNNGSFTPEFLSLAKLASGSPKILDNEAFKELHVTEIPSAGELAALERIPLKKMLRMVQSISSKTPDKQELVLEGLQVLKSSKLSKPEK